MSSGSSSITVEEETYTLSYVHGTLMVIAWMVFASTGILFARYGRLINIARRIQCLGEVIWFQIHRATLCLAALLTLIGFLIILAQAEGQWVDISNGRLFAHSILGIIIVCCSQIQIWMAIFRCNPNNSRRYIFNWLHRLTGLCAFVLSVPTIFLIIFVLPSYRTGLITILSIWSGWVVIIVIIFEFIEYRSRKTSILLTERRYTYEASGRDRTQDSVLNKVDRVEKENYNTIKMILFIIHFIVALGLSISFIVLIWSQE